MILAAVRSHLSLCIIVQVLIILFGTFQTRSLNHSDIAVVLISILYFGFWLFVKSKGQPFCFTNKTEVIS